MNICPVIPAPDSRSRQQHSREGASASVRLDTYIALHLRRLADWIDPPPAMPDAETAAAIEREAIVAQRDAAVQRVLDRDYAPEVADIARTIRGEWTPVRPRAALRVVR